MLLINTTGLQHLITLSIFVFENVTSNILL